MFNVTGGEIVIILLLALIVLGPDKLPDFVRRAGRVYGELRKMANGFKSEFSGAVDEPMREMRETANMARTWFEEGRSEADVEDPDDDPMLSGLDEIEDWDSLEEVQDGDLVVDDTDPFEDDPDWDGLDEGEDEDGEGDEDDEGDEGDAGGDDPNFYDAAGNVLDADAVRRMAQAAGPSEEGDPPGADRAPGASGT